MKVFKFVCLAALLPVVGCGVAEGELEQDQAQVGSQKQALTHRLRSTDFNTNILRNGCYDGSSPPRLRWNCLDSTNNLDGNHLNPGPTGCSWKAGTNDTVIEATDTGCYGIYIDSRLVQAVTHDPRPTLQWLKGDNVVDSGTANPGDAVATFDSSGIYDYAHSGIFMSYIRNDAGAIVGFKMADQFWENTNRSVTKHEVRKGYSGDADADKYFFIRVND